MFLTLVWAACAVAGCIYALQQNIPLGVALRVLPAFMLEAAFFYALAMERVRLRIEKWPPAGLAAALVGAAIAPYCEASLALGTFHSNALLWIAGLSAAAAFWYVVLPHKPAPDILFLALIAVVWLSKILRPLYPHLYPKLQLEVLGQLMWFRTGVFAMICVRRPQGVGFGFWPRGREWKIGALYFLIFLVPAALVAKWIGFASPHTPAAGWERTSLLALATFFGVLWVLALGEEFFFRGLLQQWMSGWLHSEWAGLIVTSCIFGAAHLWFRAFPNWRIAVMAVLLGACCGLAFRQTRSIRAPMVTHALVVTTWRIFFS